MAKTQSADPRSPGFDQQQAQAAAQKRKIRRNVETRVRNAYDSANSVRESKLQNIRRARNAYNSEFNDKNMTAESAKQWFYVHLTFEQLQAMLSEILSIYFRLERFAEVRPTIPWGEDEKAAEIMDHLMYIFWDKKTKPYSTLRSTFEATLRDGTGVVKAEWNKQTAPSPQGGKRPIVNEGNCQHIPLENVLWDPTATRPEDIRWFIHEKDIPIADLWEKQSQGIYENIDKVQKNYEIATQDENRPSRQDENPSIQDEEQQTVRIREYWGKMQMLPQSMLERVRRKGKNIPQQNVVVTTTENNVVIRPPEGNPYAKLQPGMNDYEKLPFFIFNAIPKDKTTWGRSVALELEDAQRELNKLRNQRRQNVDLAMGGKVLINTNAGSIDRDKLTSPELMGIVECQGNPNEMLEIFQPRNVTQDMAAEEQIVQSGVRRITGVSKPFAGQALSKRQTRGEVESMLERSSARLATIAEALNDSGVQPLLEFYSNCIVEFLTPKEVQELLDYKTKPPPLKQILDRDYEISLRAGLRARAKQLKVQEMEYALQTTAKILEPFPEAQLEIGLDILGEMLPKLGAEGSVKTIKKIRQMMEQQQNQGPQGSPGQPQAEAPTPGRQPRSREQRNQPPGRE